MMEQNKILIENLKARTTNHTPFWFMRQAGRYLPEYRDLRACYPSFLDLVYTPDAACEITMQPIRRFGMNGAILFSDIVVIPHALGQVVSFDAGHGPRLKPVQLLQGFEYLSLEKIHEVLEPIYETIRLTKTALKKENYDQTALIGFAGAPWTLMCYMIEGQGSKQFDQARLAALSNPGAFQKLCDLVTEATISYLSKQIESGVEAIQIFDSWSGILDEQEFERWVTAPTKKIIAALKKSHPNIPVIGFPREAGVKIMSYSQKTGIDALGVDYAMPLSWVRQKAPQSLCLQGNLDPIALLTGGSVMIDRARKILEEMAGHPFVFNLGHGVIKETPPEHVQQLCDFIRNYQ